LEVKIPGGKPRLFNNPSSTGPSKSTQLNKLYMSHPFLNPFLLNIFSPTVEYCFPFLAPIYLFSTSCLFYLSFAVKFSILSRNSFYFFCLLYLSRQIEFLKKIILIFCV
jgi:hypothetical protein